MQDNNVERAVDWIFSHPDELNAEEMEVDDDSRSAGPKFSDGPGSKLLFSGFSLFIKFNAFNSCRPLLFKVCRHSLTHCPISEILVKAIGCSITYD